MNGFEDSLRWAKEDFVQTHEAMVKFFEGKGFEERRKRDGLKSFE